MKNIFTCKYRTGVFCNITDSKGECLVLSTTLHCVQDKEKESKELQDTLFDMQPGEEQL